MAEADLVLIGGDDDARELLTSLAVRTAVASDQASIASASIALVRGGDDEALAAARAAGVPTLVLDGPDAPGAQAVHSRADVAEWVRSLLADPGVMTEARRRARDGGEPGLPRPAALPRWGRLPPAIDRQRDALAAEPPAARNRYRVLHIGTYVFGETDVVHRIVVALRRLGHEVVTVDPRRCPGLAQITHLDGVTPITVDVDRLGPLLERFEPDVIVWDAGGFHPSKDGARRLRERGIVSMHLVLSDPDANENTRAYAERFDLVATNARDCVAGYRDLGVPAVEHLPFAVDWSFVVAPVRERADWRAQVVCVGHGRPDRQATMKHLAQRFDVRVYGNNWELPAVVARDEEVVSALRGGTFHVNFPRTKAGFTNVKVGVFESIGQGGVLCTGVFDEMATLFAYDREIVGYETDEQLAAAIAYLSRHPNELDEIRRRGFARLAAEHLWERRLDGLFRTLEDEGLLAPRSDEHVRRFVVLGFWGKRNAGDDLILRVTADELQRRFPRSIIRGIGFDRGRMIVEDGFDGADIEETFEAEDRIREADALIFGGGGLVHDLTFRLSGGIPDLFENHPSGLAGLGKFLLLARIHGVPVVWHALGAGPLETPDARVLSRFLAEGAAAITVRDAFSAEALANCGIDAEIAADPTFLIPRPDDAAIARALDSYGLTRDGYLFASLRMPMQPIADLEARAAAALDLAGETTGLPVVFVPLGRGSEPVNDDVAIHARVAGSMSSRSEVLPITTTLEDVLCLLAGARTGLAMRLHASLIANTFGVPTVGLAYDEKVIAHYDRFGTREFVVPMDAEPSRIADVITSLALEPEEAADRVAVVSEAARAAASLSFDRLESIVGGNRPRGRPRSQPFPRRTSLRTHMLETQRRTLVARGRVIRDLRQQMKQLRSDLRTNIQARQSAERRLLRIGNHPAVRTARLLQRFLRRR